MILFSVIVCFHFLLSTELVWTQTGNNISKMLDKSPQWLAFKAKYGEHMEVKWNEKTKMPSLIIGPIPADKVLRNAGMVSRDNVENIIGEFIMENQPLFKVGLPELRIRRISHRIGQWSVMYEQYYQSVPVYKGILSFLITDEGIIARIRFRCHANLSLSPVPRLTKTDAVNIAKGNVNWDDIEVGNIDLLVFPDDRGVGNVNYHLVWRVPLFSRKTVIAKYFFIDAHTGQTVYQKNAYEDDAGEIDITSVKLSGKLITTLGKIKSRLGISK